MRKYVVLGINLAIIVFIVGTMLSGHPLWLKSGGPSLSSTGSTLVHAEK